MLSHTPQRPEALQSLVQAHCALLRLPQLVHCRALHLHCQAPLQQQCRSVRLDVWLSWRQSWCSLAPQLLPVAGAAAWQGAGRASHPIHAGPAAQAAVLVGLCRPPLLMRLRERSRQAPHLRWRNSSFARSLRRLSDACALCVCRLCLGLGRALVRNTLFRNICWYEYGTCHLVCQGREAEGPLKREKGRVFIFQLPTTAHCSSKLLRDDLAYHALPPPKSTAL